VWKVILEGAHLASSFISVQWPHVSVAALT
jgi:hypothetical protein